MWELCSEHGEVCSPRVGTRGLFQRECQQLPATGKWKFMNEVVPCL